MKMPLTVGITKELLEQIIGVRIDKISAASASGSTIHIELVADVTKEELTDESIN